jgi:hypothetical protein
MDDDRQAVLLVLMAKRPRPKNGSSVAAVRAGQLVGSVLPFRLVRP